MVNDASLLQAWERGYGRAPFEQALVLLGAAHPNASADELLNLSIGDRDRALLRLRQWIFGSRFESVADCPDCSEALELSFDVDEILTSWAADGAAKYVAEVDGASVSFRLPTSRDLAAVSRELPERRADALLRRCVDPSQTDVDALNETQRVGVEAAIVERDPQTDVQLSLVCDCCGCRWDSPFDIVGFLWSELNVWCHRLLAEVHLLAKSYGWGEAETLALSRWRRQVYLSMVRQ